MSKETIPIPRRKPQPPTPETVPIPRRKPKPDFGVFKDIIITIPPELEREEEERREREENDRFRRNLCINLRQSWTQVKEDIESIRFEIALLKRDIKNKENELKEFELFAAKDDVQNTPTASPRRKRGRKGRAGVILEGLDLGTKLAKITLNQNKVRSLENQIETLKQKHEEMEKRKQELFREEERIWKELGARNCEFY